MDSKTTDEQCSKKATEELGAPSTASDWSNDVHIRLAMSDPLALFINSNSLPAGSIIPELLPAEERAPLKRYFIPKWFVQRYEADYFFDSTIFPGMEMPDEFSLDEFPGELLLEVFRRVHQTDRIHSVSLVCRRWNRLLYTPGLWTSVRMDIRTEEQFTAAEAFLKREEVSHSLVKLYLCYSTDRLSRLKKLLTLTVLPEKLPKLLHYHGVGEIMDTGFEFLDEVMPMLQTLVLNDAMFRGNGFLYSALPNSISTDASKSLFKRLRNLSLNGRTFQNIPWGESVKELIVLGDYHERGNAKYPELQKLRLLLGDPQFRPSVLQMLHISSKLTTLDIRLTGSHPRLPEFMPQFVAAVRNLQFLEHLHMLDTRANIPLTGLFAPPARKSDFPSRLKYLRLSYAEPIVVEEVALSCPELRSLHLNTFERNCVISESMFIQIAETFRKLEYLRLNCVRSSLASVLNALGEDSLPHLRYLHCGIIIQDFPPRNWCRNLMLSEMADAKSLLSKRPNLMVVSGSLSSSTWFINGEAHSSVAQSLLHRLLGSEEGVCCVGLYDFDFGLRT